MTNNAALEEAMKLLLVNPEYAGDKATEILESEPGSDMARFILAASLRLCGRPADALTEIEPLAARNPVASHIQHEFALCLGATGRGEKAIEVLRKSLAVDATHAPSWRTLGDQLAAAGDEPGSEAAFEKHLATSTRYPELVEAAKLLADGKLGKAERLTRSVLKKDPLDTSAIRMLAVIGLRVGQFDDAINLLARCLELAPGFHLARQNYAVALSRRQRLDESIAEIDRLLTVEPNNPNYKLLKGSFLVHKGDHDSALAIFETLLADYPNQSNAQMNYGHTLKAVGRVEEAIRAYHRAVELRPATGEVYWSLANLKTYQFSDEEIDSMRSEVLPEGGDPDDQAHLLFALGKALEDRARYDQAFDFYERGNRIRSRHHRHNAKINVFNTARQLKSLNVDFFRERNGWGCMAPDPIFIVGLPRAGSTLLEQILSSHSAVEGTAELPDIIAISRKLGKRSPKHPAGDYPEILATLSEGQVRKLGEGYIESTRIQRHGLPFFVDKMPNNFQHVGLIHLILPNSKIIDARRHPMAGCFSNFKQLFARGQAFTYDLTDLGHYYRDYVTLMDHWDEVLPGRVHRVQYESMVSDTESEIRALLDYCGLPFEEQCLNFFETQRAIRTPSSEQVRRPVYTESVEQWRHFEAHLDPLKKALGPVLERYPTD